MNNFNHLFKLSKEILLKTKDIVQIMDELINETGLKMTLEFHYKFLVLLYIEADEKIEARKHYFGITYDNKLITRGIDTRRHDSPAFIKEFQMTLLSKLFDCNSPEDVLTTGYKNALAYYSKYRQTDES